MTEASSFERVLRFERAMHAAIAVRIEPFEWGTAYFNPDYPLVWDLNFLEVDGTGDGPTADRPTADGLIAAAEELQGAAGLGHRRIMLDDADLAETLAPRFRELGWMVNRFVFMELVREPEPPVPVRRAKEIDRDTHRATYVRTASEAPYGGVPDVVRQLSAQTDVVAGAYDVRYFGAADDDGAIASICVQYSDGEVAQVEDVATLKDHRRRGLATELLSLAISEAKRANHDLIFLVADADDWPKELYRRLGFDELGPSYDFVLPGDVVYD